MIFIHNKTGEIYELQIYSVQEPIYNSHRPSFEIGEFVLIGNDQPESSVFNMADDFTFIGFL